MDPAEFRTHGHALVEWVAAYLTGSERYPVLPRVAPGDLTRSLPASAPEHGEPFEQIFADFERLIVPALTHWNHPGFFAYFAITGSAPGVLAEFLAAALNQQAMLWQTSPAATELEDVSLSWLRELLGLPPAFEGVIYDTASISTVHALATARDEAMAGASQYGLAGRREVNPGRVFCSEHAHSSVEKAARLLGLGREAVCRIPIDDQFQMRPETLRDALDADRDRGITPVAVVATLGTTSTTSVDPVGPIAALCRARGIWLHVDAAYAGAAAMLPEYRPLFAGWEDADSIVVNPHKWLFVPFDLSAFYCRRMDAVRRSFALVPEYLEARPASGAAKNLMDTGVQLGRRFRALKLWFILRHLGAERIRAALTEHIRLARLFASWVDATPAFERLAPVPFSVVCFRARPSGVAPEALNQFNERLLDTVNADGDVFLSHTRVGDAFAIRLAVGHLRTRETHVARAWELLTEKTRLMTSRT